MNGLKDVLELEKRIKGAFVSGNELAVMLAITYFPGTYTDIKEKVKLSDSSLAFSLRRLMGIGFIKKEQGLYLPTEEGAKFVVSIEPILVRMGYIKKKKRN